MLLSSCELVPPVAIAPALFKAQPKLIVLRSIAARPGSHYAAIR